MKTTCKNCGQRPANRSGRLCYQCFRDEQKRTGETTSAIGTPQNGVPAAGDESLLDAMKWVQSHPKDHDRTQLQRDCRAWKERKLVEFMNRRSDLEKAALAGKTGPSAPKGAFAGLASPAFEGSGECPTCGTWVNDQGSERALKLLREGMARDEAEQAREDAERAARPGAKELGRARQEELKAALWRERQVMLECTGRYQDRRSKDTLTRNEATMGFVFIEWNEHCRAYDLELAVWPDPENVLGSLEKALKRTADREQEWRKGVAELEGSAA
jgi:hypothetical protein